MDRMTFHHFVDRKLPQDHSGSPPRPAYSPPPPPYSSAQPTSSMSISDPFHSTRDPFLPGTQSRRESNGLGSRAWPLTPGQHPNQQLQHHPQHQQPHSPPPQAAGQGQPLPPLGMPPPLSYDSTHRLAGAGSPPQYPRGQLDPPPALPSFPARNMPPPSPPQMPSSSHLRSAPPGPPTASPFSGVRDLASHRSGMSISSILGGNEERKPIGSPHSASVHPSPTQQSTRPPSPGRARSSSMRESSARGYRDFSPLRGAAPYRDASRASAEPRREPVFGSPPFRSNAMHSFRTFQPLAQEQPQGPQGPDAQPVDPVALRSGDDRHGREVLHEGRFGVFRQYGDQPAATPSRVESGFYRQDRAPFTNGTVSGAPERSVFAASPQAERESRPAPAPLRYHPTAFGSPLRDEQAPLFRPATNVPTSHPASDLHRNSTDAQAHDMRRQLSRPSPPLSDNASFDRARNGYPERPMTLEEHQRMERIHSGNRKESEGSVHRSILNISPDLDRKGRSSPLPQAVQGAQPRHIGPAGDHPGIKMEFGRMFPGLGAGVGSTPPIGQSANGFSSPSRLSPARLMDGDVGRHANAAADNDDTKSVSKGGGRGRRGGRRTREELERADSEGRHTPDVQRGSKRSKNNHPAHHHHHHHYVRPHHHHFHPYEPAEPAAAGSFSMMRVTSNPGLPVDQQTTPVPPHHHHHHHHHHHQPRPPAPAARKPTKTIDSSKVLDFCAAKPRKHLGSQLYTTEVSMPPAADTPLYAKVKFSSQMKAIPVFQGRENCTFTVRVPRYYLSTSGSASAEGDSLGFEEICQRRQLWGSDIYTDDSDVVAAAVHSGWLQGDFGEYNDDLRDVYSTPSQEEEPLLLLESRPKTPAKVPAGYDAHITLLVLPPLEHYASTNEHHIWSREWNKYHDGMSFMIHSIEFVDEPPATRFAERGAAGRKKRLAMEEAKRREAAASLLMFATGGHESAAGAVRVGA